MNRKTKYRAWDTTSNKMVYSNLVDDWKLFVNFDGDVGGYEITDGHDADKRIERCGIYNDRFILMQFTGLYDRTGMEIYEGDILKDEYNRILLVEWWKCGFGFKALCETNFIRANNIMEWFEGDTSKPEIIGNIHANPGLLEQT